MPIICTEIPNTSFSSPRTRMNIHPEGRIGAGPVSHQWALGGCGVGSLEAFGRCGLHRSSTFEEKAEWMAALYRALYTCGHTLYALTDQQTPVLHDLLLEIGARQIDEFPNLYHGPAIMRVFRVNVRNAAGRFCDKYGNPFKEPPENPPAPVDVTEPQKSFHFQELPKEPV